MYLKKIISLIYFCATGLNIIIYSTVRLPIIGPLRSIVEINKVRGK
jgi:hypothetical protein